MNWEKFIEKENTKKYFIDLKIFLEEEYKTYTIYPPKEDIFRALKLTPFDNVKVVIIGQDPYHEHNQANGLAFSVTKGVKLPPSLKNIYKEITNEYGYEMSNDGDLTTWANQGVLLINAVLTVRAHNANSHKGHGWEKFTDNLIMELNKRSTPIIFVFWGNNAMKKQELITNKIHYILKSSHPSPLSCYQGFIGCNHFIEINKILANNNMKAIDWKK